jgi:ABC-2 type transport system permease protein
MQNQRNDVSPDEDLNNNIAQIEYQLASAIRRVAKPQKKQVAILQGHGEAKPSQLADLYKSLKEYYTVDFVDITQYKVGRLEEYAAIIIAKPDTFFEERFKFELDQYLVKGGNILLCTDNLVAEMDSLRGASFFTGNKNLNLEDFLFRNGIKLNYDIIQDLNCHYIPLLKQGFAGQQRANMVKWPYFPVITPTSDHPIVNNIGAIWFKFPNSMDTVSNKQNPDIKKTILLTTSPATKTQQHPAQININMVSGIDPNTYRSGYKNVAVLIEGKFKSMYANRLLSSNYDKKAYGDVKMQDKPGKMIVVSDGDVLLNQLSKAYQKGFPLGYDFYTKQTFANKTFALNCIDYMVDDNGLISLRSKQFKLRMLSTQGVKTMKGFWQGFNTMVPLGIVVVFGIVFNYVRKRKYSV